MSTEKKPYKLLIADALANNTPKNYVLPPPRELFGHPLLDFMVLNIAGPDRVKKTATVVRWAVPRQFNVITKQVQAVSDGRQTKFAF